MQAFPRRVGLSIGLALAAITGCASEEELYEVSGQLTYEGAPVESATIMFLDPKTQFTNQITVKNDGAYSVELPPASYTVVVEPVMVNRKPQGAEAYPDTVYQTADDIPERYRRAETTSLAAEVSEDAVHNFDMTAGE